jgi:hypothetical protein
MAYFGKKSYGSYKTDSCVFCGATAYGKNKIGLPACKAHKDTDSGPDLKCTCGEYIDVAVGKFGAYAKCIRCGNKKLQQIMEYNAGLPKEKTVTASVKKTASKPSASKTVSKAEYEYGILLD